MTGKYVALDVHSATTSFCVREGSGRVVMEGVVETKGKELVSFIRGVPGKVHLTFEESAQAAWLYDLLRRFVAEVLVCDPRRNRLLEDGSKTDAIDARKLSDLYRLGALKPVYHGEHGTAQLKQLVAAHRQLVGDTVRVKNRLKGLYRSRGVAVRGSSVYRPKEREEWISKLNSWALQKRACWLYEELERLEEVRAEAERAMIRESGKHRGSALLQSVPGIGPIRAAQIVGHVDTPHRFRTKRQFWSYSGLAVVQRSSSDYAVGPSGIVRKARRSTRGLTRDYNRTLKMVFKSAAVEATRRGLKAAYQARLEAGMKPEMAQLTMARKLAAICLAVWKKGERYDENKAIKRVA